MAAWCEHVKRLWTCTRVVLACISAAAAASMADVTTRATSSPKSLLRLSLQTTRPECGPREGMITFRMGRLWDRKKKSSMELRAGVGCRGRVSIICQTRLARHWGLDPWRRSANRAILAACHIRRMPCNSTPFAGTSPEPTRINPYAHDAHAGKKEIQKSDMRVVTALPRPFWKVTRTSQPVKIRGALPQHSARPTLAQLLTSSALSGATAGWVDA